MFIDSKAVLVKAKTVKTRLISSLFLKSAINASKPVILISLIPKFNAMKSLKSSKSMLGKLRDRSLCSDADNKARLLLTARPNTGPFWIKTSPSSSSSKSFKIKSSPTVRMIAQNFEKSAAFSSSQIMPAIVCGGTLSVGSKDSVGLSVGSSDTVGFSDGSSDSVGFSDGSMDTVGLSDGDALGAVGVIVGRRVGFAFGGKEGRGLGFRVGSNVGWRVGNGVGIWVFIPNPISVGKGVGRGVGRLLVG